MTARLPVNLRPVGGGAQAYVITDGLGVHWRVDRHGVTGWRAVALSHPELGERLAGAGGLYELAARLALRRHMSFAWLADVASSKAALIAIEDEEPHQAVESRRAKIRLTKMPDIKKSALHEVLFALESVAHLQGRERILLPIIDAAREELRSIVKAYDQNPDDIEVMDKGIKIIRDALGSN